MYQAKFVKQGNIKLGASIWTWNKLAGSGIIAGCKGTCGNHCKGCYNPEDPKKSPCYVFKSYRQYGWDNGTPVRAHIRNTNIIRKNIKQAFEDIRSQLKRAKNKPKVIRLHSSGELETTKELRMWLETASMYPETSFYIYTKAFKIVDKVLTSLKAEEIPKNFFINISVWHNNGIKMYNKWKHLETIRAFVYDDGYDYSKKLKIDCYCPAYNKEGKLSHELTCDKCKICFQSKAKVCGCYSH